MWIDFNGALFGRAFFVWKNREAYVIIICEFLSSFKKMNNDEIHGGIR